jgi:hypothetical protein
MDIVAHIFESLIMKAVENRTLEVHDAGDSVKLMANAMGIKIRLATLTKKEMGFGTFQSIK